MRFIVIINEKAGSATAHSEQPLEDTVHSALAAASIESVVHVVTPSEIEARLREAVAARPDAIVIGGGDGTVRSAASALADTGLTLGVLPLGTLNHFAKDLGMPRDVKDAIAVFAGGQVREVDLGEVNGKVFINNCSLGTYAEAVRRRDALRKKGGHGKWFAMVWASFQAFRTLKRMRLRIATDEHPAHSLRTPLVVVANNSYSAPVLSKNLRPCLDEGRLWVYTAHVHRHLAALRMVWQSLVRTLDAAEGLTSEGAKTVRIESQGGPLLMAMDGEVVDLPGPLHFRIRKRALRVLVPPKNRTAQ